MKVYASHNYSVNKEIGAKRQTLKGVKIRIKKGNLIYKFNVTIYAKQGVF